MLWSEIIADAAEQLHRASVADAELNAELLAVHLIGGWKRTDINPYLHQQITHEQQHTYQTMLSRRLGGEPLQYITGETEFYGLRLYSDPSALIPRPDTETLVEVTLSAAKQFDHPTILDIGTGSGAAIIAAAYHLPNALCTALDISADALHLAKRNAERHHLSNIVFREMDIRGDLSALGSFDIVISNPPYIPAADIAGLDREVREYEPRIALTDEADGFSFYYHLIDKCRGGLLHSGGDLIVEVGFDMAESVAEILRTNGFIAIETVKDHSGVERVVRGVYDVTND
jgi:release factor glutamine methyltransferase